MGEHEMNGDHETGRGPDRSANAPGASARFSSFELAWLQLVTFPDALPSSTRPERT
jgi:hypothetical protein